MDTKKHRRAFISYSRSDTEFALELAKELRAAGYPIWLDQLDIPTGVRWDDEVEKALRESEIFLIILTTASVSSDNVKDEIGYAIDHDKRIMPVLLEKCEIPLRLRRFQYVDFSKVEFGEGIERAKQLLESLITERSTPGVMVNPEPKRQTASNRGATPAPTMPNKNRPVQLQWIGYAIGILLLVACCGALGVLSIFRDSIFPQASNFQSPAPFPSTQTIASPTNTNLLPTPTSTSTNLPPTAIPTPTVNPIPIIDHVDLRYTTTGNTVTVYQDIYFRDEDGDVNYVRYQLIDISPGYSADIKNGPVTVPAEEQKTGGMFTGTWTCSESAIYDVSLLVTLYDLAGHQSNSISYTMNCR